MGIEMKENEKPICAVNGLVAKNGMCGYVIVGGSRCGFKGECQHQISVEQCPSCGGFCGGVDHCQYGDEK